MTPRKKGKKFEIQYRVKGYVKPFCERFDTLAEANLRIAQIEMERSTDSFQPPKPKAIAPARPVKLTPASITLSELLDQYVQVYGLNHWGDSYLSCCQHRIDDYIKPFIGDMLVKDITPVDLDRFLDFLQEQKAVVQKGRKDTGKPISPSVIEKVHSILRSSLGQAVRWGFINRNPAEDLSPPDHKTTPRDVWSPEEALEALALCEQPVLKTSMLLALGCSMRIGEILGLTWDCVDCSDKAIENGTAHVSIVKEIKRCDKESLEKLQKKNRGNVLFVFPERNKTKPCSTSLVLKTPKTDSSVRDVYLPKSVALQLQQVKATQEALKQDMGSDYQDYNLVIAWNDGRPYEERRMALLLKEFIKANGLREVVFHSLRHCSTSVKLKISRGNIKAVQSDTGHAQAKMVTEVYAHTFQNDRKELAEKMETQFFQKKGKEPDSQDQAVELLQSNPELLKLFLSALQTNTD